MDSETQPGIAQLCCKRFGLFILFIIFKLTDFILDLDFCILVNLLEKGLVYGPFEDGLRYSLIAFTILATVFFVLEGYGLYYEIKYNKPRFYFYSETLSMISTWFDDVPNIIIALRVALCREEAISYVQYAKAFWAMIIILVQMIILLCYIQRFRKRGKTAKRVLNILQLIGSIIIFICSITILVSIIHGKDSHGNLKFKLPKNLTGDIYDERIYFDNVSIYVHHRNFDYSAEEQNYIQLTSIYALQNSADLKFKISFDDETKTRFIIWKYEDSNFVASQCFTLDRVNKRIEESNATGNCSQFITSNSSSDWIFSSNFVKRNPPYLIFGNIIYNAVEKSASGNCTRNISATNYQVKYFRLKPNLVKKGHLLKSQNSDQAQFFSIETDLIDIHKVWNTGLASCDSSGYLEPQFNSGIEVNCDE